jgi:3-oxoacyl-[acyl-carrier-protein] synthase II
VERRVVVTGVGLATPLGFEEGDVWRRLLAGETGIGPLTAFDTEGYLSPYKVKLAAQVESEPVAEALRAMGRRPMDRSLDLALVAGERALLQAGLIESGVAPEPCEVAVIMGTGTGSAQSTFAAFERFAGKGPKGMLPSSVPRMMYNSISANLSMHFKLTGANYVVVSACTSSTNAIGDAHRRVRTGETEIVVAGGTDGHLDPFFYGVWNNLGVLSQNPDPALALRPFDVDREGTILGEGAGVLVVESLESARRRGARIRGEILGYGESSDAGHVTGPSAEGQARAIVGALTSAGIGPEDVGYVNAHGTATRSNDSTESAALRSALGGEADRILVGSSKSFFGHTLGASGALETAVTLLALEHGVAPPNFNLYNPDPECTVRAVGREPEPIERPVALKNSFGFGGGNAVLVLAPAPRAML